MFYNTATTPLAPPKKTEFLRNKISRLGRNINYKRVCNAYTSNVDYLLGKIFADIATGELKRGGFGGGRKRRKLCRRWQWRPRSREGSLLICKKFERGGKKYGHTTAILRFSVAELERNWRKFSVNFAVVWIALSMLTRCNFSASSSFSLSSVRHLLILGEVTRMRASATHYTR